MQVKLFVGEDLDVAVAAREAAQQLDAFIAQPGIHPESVQTAVADHRFDPVDRCTFVVVITLTYQQLEAIGPRVARRAVAAGQ